MNTVRGVVEVVAADLLVGPVSAGLQNRSGAKKSLKWESSDAVNAVWIACGRRHDVCKAPINGVR